MIRYDHANKTMVLTARDATLAAIDQAVIDLVTLARHIRTVGQINHLDEEGRPTAPRFDATDADARDMALSRLEEIAESLTLASEGADLSVHVNRLKDTTLLPTLDHLMRFQNGDC